LHELRKLSENLGESKSIEDLRAAALWMVELKCPEAARYLWEAYAKSWNADRKRALLSAIADIGDGSQAVPLAAESIRAFPRSLRRHAAERAFRCDRARTLSLLDSVLFSEAWKYASCHRVAAVEALHAIRSGEAIERLVKAVGDKDGDVAAVAAEALALLRHAPAVPAMIERLKTAKDDRDLRMDIAEALMDLTGEAFGADAALWEDWWKKSGAAFSAPEPRPHKISPLWEGPPGPYEGVAPDDPYSWEIGNCPMDLVILYDTTGSLCNKWPYLSTAVDSLLRELHRRAPRMRTGAVRYRATENSMTYRIMPFPMTRNLDKLRESVREASFGGGSGGLNLALAHALTQMRWRLKARRVIWIFGDMSPDAAGGGPTAAAFWVDNARREDGFLISTLYVESAHGGSHRAVYRGLAELGGGRFYEYDEAERQWVDWTSGAADRKRKEFPHVLAERLLTPRKTAAGGRKEEGP
jgi:hypothetical protein